MPPLAALPTVPAVARGFVRSTLPAWCLERLTGNAELVVSELASNAVAASADRSGRPAYVRGHMMIIRVCLLSDGVRVLLEVWDQAPGTPVIRDTAVYAEAGRGLMLLGAIADRWGWSPAAGRPGKVVWAELSLLTRPMGLPEVSH
jgi:anti-sigma regulatory factor (Ser/Thr protein kinase)